MSAAEVVTRARGLVESMLQRRAALGGAGVSGPGTEALTSSGLIALGAQRRNAEEAGYPAM